MPNLSTNYQNVLEINITPSEVSPAWAEVSEGWNNLTQAINEVIKQTSYLNDAGWGRTDVTGGQLTVTVAGDRVYGDPAQDYIFSDAVQLAFGAARKTQMRLTRPDASIIEWNVTIAKITDGGGAAQEGAGVSVEIHGNGAPTLLTGALIEQLVVVSVEGTLSGDTAVYVNPVIEALNSYKYKIAASVDLPSYDQVLTTGWTAWNGSAEITASTGDQIVIAEVVTASNKARKAGKAVITAATE